MKTLTAAAAIVASLSACNAQPRPDATPLDAEYDSVEDVIVTLPGSVARPPFEFTAQDERLLDEIQRATFRYFWDECAPETGMVLDRTGAKSVSVAGVGFQVACIAVGEARGWVSGDDARARVLRILRALESHPDNRKAGLFFHYLDPATGGPSLEGYESVVSTIDSALLFAGLITASSHFGGEIATIADRLAGEVDWSFFVSGDEAHEWERGFISLGWRPKDPERAPTGEGELLPFYWADTGDEQLLVNFLAVAAPREAHRVEPATYYRLRRWLGRHGEIGPFVWFPWSGALFTNAFAHIFIDYGAMGPDDPKAHGVEARPRVDWWANSAMACMMHRAKAIENPKGLPTLGALAWGLTACDAKDGYSVPGLFPEPMAMPGARPKFDYAAFEVEDAWGDGTVAPYGAGMAMMFMPREALAALRHYRSLRGAEGRPLVWCTPGGAGKAGQSGFLDAFNLGNGWVAPDQVAIDQGPLLLSIENARTGFVWERFHSHGFVRGGMARLGLERGR